MSPIDDNQIAISPEQFSTLSDAGKATLTAQLEMIGATADQITRIAGARPPVAGPAPQQHQANPPVSVPVTPASHIPVEQRLSAFKNLRAAGVPEATLQKAAAEEGIAWSDIDMGATAPPPQQMSLNEANQKLADTSGPLAASADPADHTFQFDPAHIDGFGPDEVRDIRDMFAGAFHAARIPLSVSQPLFRELMAAANKYEDMDDATRTLAFREEGARLRRTGNVEQIKADAEYAYGKLPADFRAVVDERHLMTSADAYLAMSRAGALMRAREGRKK